MNRNSVIGASIVVMVALIGLLSFSTRDIAPDLAPFFPTPMIIVERMLEMAEIGPDDVVYDLGCGDGRIVIAAATRFGARGVCVEYDPEVAQRAIDNVRNSGVEDLVEVIVGDAMKVDVSPASVVTLYLLPESNVKLRPSLEASLAPGSRVLSHDWDMEGWQAKQVERIPDGTGRTHTLFLWEMGTQTEPPVENPGQ